MTDRLVTSAYAFAPGSKKKSGPISRRAALGLWLSTSIVLWLGIVGLVVALF
jgi:hypothetical protein